jgi:predicted dehydrogenase
MRPKRGTTACRRIDPPSQGVEPIMRRGNLSRRGFLQDSTLALAATGLPLWYARTVTAALDAKPERREEGPVLGAIGTGSRGLGVMDAARRVGGRFVAVCDVDAEHRRSGSKKCADREGAQYVDYRELLDRDDIQAVTVVTPDHWHALIAVEAMRRGKDVYCEKPLSLTIAEGRAMVEAARKYDRVFQTGSQQRSDDRFRLACELVRNGRLGKIKTVETRIGENPKAGPFPTGPVPEGLDWNLWLGQTPEVDYVERRCHYEFRWWYEYSGGKVTDWGAHHNDIAQWGLGTDETGPIEVVSERLSEPVNEPNAYNCPIDFQITYTYDKDVNAVCDGTQVICTGKGENGVKSIGEGGAWIFVDRSKIEASDPKLLEEPLPEGATKLEVSRNHMRNFFEAAASRNRPICDVAIGHRSATVCHIGNISLRLGGRKLVWNPRDERFFGDALANQMLSREMRKPWRLEV